MARELRAAALLLALTGLATWLGIGDTLTSFATRFAEDTPLLFAHFFADPAHWRGDMGMVNAHLYTIGSLCNWLPAVLLRDHGLDPKVPTLALCYLQNLVLALALYLYSGNFTRRTDARLLTALFALTAMPEQWNPSLFVSSFTAIYPAQMAIGLILLCAHLLLSGRELAAYALLSACGLVHVSLSLHMTMLCGIFILLTRADPFYRPLPYRLTALALASAVFLARAALVSRGVGEVVDHGAMVAILKESGHVYPWLSRWSRVRIVAVLLTLSGYLALALWAFRRKEVASPRCRALVRSAMWLAPLLVASYASGILLELPALQKLTFTRFIGVICLLVLPHVITQLVETLEEADGATAAASMMVLALLGGHGFGLFFIPIAVLFLGPRPRLTGGLLVGWLGLTLASPLAGKLLASPAAAQSMRAWLAPAVLLSPDRLAITMVLAALAALAVRIERARGRLAWLACAAIAFFFLQNNVRAGRATNESLPRSTRDAQLWADGNTASSAIFVIVPDELPWRTLSNRRVVSSDVGPGLYYSGNREQYEYRERLRAFLRAHGAEKLSELRSQDALLAFAKAFGGDYLVVERERKIELPKVYENEKLSIFRLPTK